MDERIREIGVMGGTFNPPHLGHLRAAQSAADELKLGLVLLIPDYLPPHKETAAGSPDARQRLEMVRLAAAADPRLRADGCEVVRGGKSYTVDTLRELKTRYPDAALTFICGTDMFLTLDRWYRAEELLQMARFAVAPRETGEEAEIRRKQQELREKFGASSILLHNPVVELSSSDVREQIRNGDFSGGPDGVAAYIKENRLFLADG